MRILQIITLSELGGAQTVVANLSNKLNEKHEVIVAAGEGDGKLFQLLDNRIKVEKIKSLVRRLSPLNEIKAILQMKRLYKKYNPDIIHLHSSKAALLGRLAFPKDKIVYTVHGFDSIRLAYRKFLPLEKILQHKCASIVGVSKYDYENLKKEGITNNVNYVYNGIIQPKKLCQDPFENMVKHSHKILCIARISPQKNLQLFIEMAKLMSDTAFIWVGNQHQPDFDFPENVYFMGNIANAGSYTEYADVFVLPSNYEGLPMVIIESMANGTPVVASAVGGITELLDGRNGYVVENNADSFVEKIRYILESDIRRKEMGENAKKTFQKSFTVENMANGYLSIYNTICKKNE